MVLTSVNLTQLALKAAVITRNDSHWPFKVTQGHQFCYRSKARIRLAVSDRLLNSVLSRTVFELSRHICSNYRFWQRVPPFISMIRGKPWTLDCKIWSQELETSFYWCDAHIFRYNKPFRLMLPVWQTDRRTHTIAIGWV